MKGDKKAGNRSQRLVTEKQSPLPWKNVAYSENKLLTVPWFDNIPVCHRCGVLCPRCRNELASELPSEMSTARAILSFDDIHENNQNTGDDENDEEGDNEQGVKAPKEPVTPTASPQMGVQLRSRKRRHIASN